MLSQKYLSKCATESSAPRKPLESGTAFFLILVCSLYHFGSSTASASDFAVEADRYLKGLVQSNQFSGAVLVARNGKSLLSKGYSFANREHDIPNTPQTRFRLGSITKQFTAMCIMILQKEGKLSVQDPVGRYVEESPETWKPMTLHHLLTHTSGIPGFTEFPDNLQFERLPTTVEATVRRFKDKPLKFSPGEKFNYSNSGYVLLGYIIEKVSGKKYEEVVKEKIFEPLGMKNSGYDHPWIVLKNRASGYALKDGQVVNCVHFEMDTPHAAGALYSNVEDLLVWDQALYTEKLLSNDDLRTLFTPGKGGYGYGWVIGEAQNRRYLEHGGGIAGFRTQIFRYPEEKLTVIVLSNFETANPNRISRNLADMLFGRGQSNESVD